MSCEKEIKVPESIAESYHHASPKQRNLALLYFAKFLKKNKENKSQESKINLLKTIEELQDEAEKNGMTIELAKELIGEDAENLF